MTVNLEVILDQDFKFNFRPKQPCKYPKVAKLVNSQLTRDLNLQAPTTSDNRETVPIDGNIPVTVRNLETQAQKWPRPQHPHRRIDQISEGSAPDYAKDYQTRSGCIPPSQDIAPQPSTSYTSTSDPFRCPNTYPNVLSLGRGRGNFLLANWICLVKGCGHRLVIGHDTPQTPLVLQSPPVLQDPKRKSCNSSTYRQSTNVQRKVSPRKSQTTISKLDMGYIRWHIWKID